jgi:hypothetical protein
MVVTQQIIVQRNIASQQKYSQRIKTFTKRVEQLNDQLKRADI